MSILDPQSLLTSFGLIGLFVIVFVESGLLAGFFLPGDSLLFAAGILAAKDNSYHFMAAIAVIIFAGLLGDSLGYYLGKKYGQKIFAKTGLQEMGKVDQALKLLSQRRFLAIILSKFTPIVRTIFPGLIGSLDYSYKEYMFMDFVGLSLWSTSLVLSGYYFGSKIPNIDKYILPVVALIVVASFTYSFWHLHKIRKHQKNKNKIEL
jgi:membrane-associated protein